MSRWRRKRFGSHERVAVSSGAGARLELFACLHWVLPSPCSAGFSHFKRWSRLRPIGARAVFPIRLLSFVPLHAPRLHLVPVRCSGRSVLRGFQKRSAARSRTSLWPSPALSARCVPLSPNTALGATCHRIPVRIVRVVSCPLRRLRHLGSRRICAQRRRCMVNSTHVVRFRASPTLGRHGDGDS